MKGKFIVLYGANNLGKSAQLERLSDNLHRQGKTVKVIKYPVYDLEPTGPRINAALREGLELSAEELQIEFAQNRKDFEPTLRQCLDRGEWVISEDYKATGIAWGITYGIPLERMEEINSGLLNEDLAILLDGERFTSGIERKHKHERDAKWERARAIHLELAERYGWECVNANQLEKNVASDIWKIVEASLI